MAHDEGALRADLQEFYGMDLDHAAAGGHSAQHVAALVAHLPEKARLRVANDADAAWGMRETLLALLVNSLNLLIYGMSDPRRRGKRPDAVGPSWMRGEDGRTLPARVLTVAELVGELGKSREEANG